MSADKPEFRRRARQRLREWTPQQLDAASAAIAKALLPLVSAGDTVLAYWPLASEPDIRSTLEVWLEDGVHVCLPRVEGPDLSPRRVDAFRLMQSGLGVLEPDPEEHQEVAADSIDAVLVPGVAFTRSGARLGRGGGFYDRFLGRLPPGSAKIGVAFSCQVFEIIPLEGHDIVLDRIVTDNGPAGTAGEGCGEA